MLIYKACYFQKFQKKNLLIILISKDNADIVL